MISLKKRYAWREPGRDAPGAGPSVEREREQESKRGGGREIERERTIKRGKIIALC